MKMKGDAHETLSLLFKIYGVPHKMVMDVSKKQTLGPFRKKCQETDCHKKIRSRILHGNYRLRGTSDS